MNKINLYFLFLHNFDIEVHRSVSQISGTHVDMICL